ncbi:phage integrase SAM-like domain-containing protein [Crenobacter cavernae]|uniref:Core-binding (CB) domain-containing protein n=1 Tax=Crenobacter cavernae TaxID=2290923 RepID=A0ABY0FE29_9NEIS|nr:phage integrase SAM-like domain-containing protein [Crenobacter cavernae]RXZ43123.1 hypothetical protein EBB06_10910 [Crenobacter cavernae]
MDIDVAKLPYLHKRNQTWIFRAGIPAKLRPFANGLHEFKRPLGNSREAAQAHYPAVLQEWENLRTKLETHSTEQSAGEPELAAAIARLSQPVHAYKHLGPRELKLMAHFEAARQYCWLEAHDTDVPEMSDAELDDYQRELETLLAEATAGLRRLRPSEAWAEAVCEELGEVTGFTLHRDCPERPGFLLRLLGQESQALKQALERLNGNFIPTPAKPMLPALKDMPALTPASSSSTTSTSFLAAFEAWDSLSSRRDETVQEYRGLLEKLARYLTGKQYRNLAQTPLELITKRSIENWLTHVAKSQGVGRKTLVKYRGAVNTILNIAVARDLLPTNPVAAVRLATLALKDTNAQLSKNPKLACEPFSTTDLDHYFTGPLFQNPAFDPRLPPAVAYWFPLLLRFTGARPQEIAHLMSDDIVEDHGRLWIYVFSDAVAPNQRERPTKTGVSLRRIPVSRHLLELGFADYVKMVPKEHWLLPMPVGGKYIHNRARYALKYLGQYLRQTLGITSKRLVTYSFRHTVIDECRVAGVTGEDRDAFVGHAEGDHRHKNAGEIVYGHRWYPAQPLMSVIDRLDEVMWKPAGLSTWRDYARR